MPSIGTDELEHRTRSGRWDAYLAWEVDPRYQSSFLGPLPAPERLLHLELHQLAASAGVNGENSPHPGLSVVSTAGFTSSAIMTLNQACWKALEPHCRRLQLCGELGRGLGKMT